MLSISDLPTEVLLKIIDETCPKGIVQLARCSKRLFEVAEDHLKQHIEDTQTWNFNWPCDDFGYGYGADAGASGPTSLFAM